MLQFRPSNSQGATPISASIVDMSGVEFSWPGRRSFSISVSDFRVARGDRVLLLGPSGSGKSTLLSLLTSIIVPDTGAVRVLGTDTTTLSPTARDRFRAEHFGVIFQQFNLLPYASVVDNVELPLAFAPARRNRAPKGEARRLLAALGLDASTLADAPAASLSVGQQQRVAVARALIGTPELVVADEPTSALDRPHQSAFLDLLFSDLDKAGTTLIMVSHDETLTHHFNRVVRLADIVRVAEEVTA